MNNNPNSSNPLPFYLCIAGPTASGKTAVALEIARRWPVEIISVDSALVYRGMDIGTAKPTREEQAVASHHLIDILDPAQAYSAADFVKDAQRLIKEISSRGNIPLLVGGTMLYFKALLDGLDDLPAADQEVRTQLDAQAAELGWPAMHQCLNEVDPVTAQRLKPNDSQRIQRALEVWMVSGQPISAFYENKPQRSYPPFLSLEPLERKWLHSRIEQRFAQMLAGGFLDEVRTLMQKEDLHPDLPSMRAVGYRQAWQALTEHGMRSDAVVSQELMQTGVAATRQLAKRQITWLRAMPYRTVIHGDDLLLFEKAQDWFTQQLV